ncbi:MAG: hypothetical protein ACO391_14425, partial [Pseudomonadales bacterium]
PGHRTIQAEGTDSEGGTRAINAGVLIQAGPATGGGGLAVPVPGLTPLMTAILAALLSGLGLWVRRDHFIIQAPPHKAGSTHRKTPNRAILKK